MRKNGHIKEIFLSASLILTLVFASAAIFVPSSEAAQNQVSSLSGGLQSGTPTYGQPLSTASFTITLTPSGDSEDGSATMSVSAGLPAGAAALFSPDPVPLPGNSTTPVDTTLTVTTGTANAGTYMLTISQSTNAVTTTVSLVISPATPTASVTNSPVTYDGTPKSASVACSGGGAASNILTGGAAMQTNAGTYGVTADCAASTNYNAAVGISAGNFVITTSPCVETTWKTTYDGGSFDYASGLALDSVGNVYVTGTSSSGTDRSFATIKYNSSGSEVWTKLYDPVNNAYASGISIDNSGNTYVAGYSPNGIDYDYVTIKYDSSGNEVWTTPLVYDSGSRRDDYARAIAVDTAGYIYTTGETYNGLVHAMDYDYLTVKYNPDGTESWHNTYSAGSLDYATGITTDSIGNVYVAGSSRNGTDYDFATIKYDPATGDSLWMTPGQYDSGYDDIARAIAVDGSGNVFVTGYSYNGLNYDLATVKYDSTGAMLWAKTFDGGYDDAGMAVAVDGSGNVYVSGESFNGSDYDYLVITYDQDGAVLWAWLEDSGDDDSASGIAVNGSDVYITGSSSSDTSSDFVTIKFLQACNSFRITTPLLKWGEVGSSYSEILSAASGVLPYTWGILSGSLPGGLTINSSGVISGTPTTAGTYTFTVRVTDAAFSVVDKQFSIVIFDAIAISTSSLPFGTVGSAYNQQVVAAGGETPYTWSRYSGTIPPGLTLNASSGVISGTPTTTGTFTFTVKAIANNGVSATKSFTVPVYNLLSITTASLPAGTVGVSYSKTLAATGGKIPYTWSLASGTLPAGLNISAAGVISGTPTSAGISSFTVQVTDANGTIATKGFSIVTSLPLVINTASLSFGTRGSAYNQTVTASGGTGPYTWIKYSGTMPPGLTINSSGVISGTPTAVGNFNFTIRVTDVNSRTASKSFTVSIYYPLSITTASLSAGTAGKAYAKPLAATGGKIPYAWSLASGTLPAGLNISAAGVISGTPTSAGISSFTVKVTDANGTIATRALSILVN